MVEVVDNSPSRSLETEFLRPSYIQENLRIGEEESLRLFTELATRLKELLEVLAALVDLHEVVFEWSSETCRVIQLCEAPVENEIIDSAIEKLSYLYDDYKVRGEAFQRFPLGAREAMYSVEFEAETDLGRWLDCLEKGGHAAKPGVTLL